MLSAADHGAAGIFDTRCHTGQAIFDDDADNPYFHNGNGLDTFYAADYIHVGGGRFRIGGVGSVFDSYVLGVYATTDKPGSLTTTMLWVVRYEL